MVCSLRLVLDVYGQVPLGKGRSVGHNATWLDEHCQDPQAEMGWDSWKIASPPFASSRGRMDLGSMSEIYSRICSGRMGQAGGEILSNA